MHDKKMPVISVLGGTGAIGKGLCLRWLSAGFEVVIGSRDGARAQLVAEELQNKLTGRGVAAFNLQAMGNLEAAAYADIAVLTVPFAHQVDVLRSVAPALDGKILVDVTVPLVPPKVARVQLPQAGSAGQIAQSELGAGVSVVTAFQNVAAHHLQGDGDIPCDVLVCGNSRQAREEVVKLAEAAGMRAYHAGLLPNSAAADALTSVLININKQFGKHAGIRITGLDRE
jgi:NADPH-dependent F420 reductase